MQQMLSVSSLILIGLFIAGCVAVPVQEMTDARLAIQAAEEAGAKQTKDYAQAQQLLKKAQHALQKSHYSQAELFAVEAKELAIKARLNKATEEVISP